MSTAPEAVSRFPLEWPSGWTRTPAQKRQAGTFTQTKHDTQDVRRGDQVVREKVTKQARVTIYVATNRLEDQLDRLGATNATLSTNMGLKMNGRPRSEEENLPDPGAAVYFRFRGKATVLACDKYLRVADNIAAMAAHIDALRRIERYGVGTIEQALAGYKALPADTAANWRAVFGFPADSSPSTTQVDRAYKEAAKKHHPDQGGSDVEMSHLNRARDYALAELRA